MNIEERIEIAILFKYYGNMLTLRQQDIINMYVDNNLSLAEVGEEIGISRQAVKDAIDNSLITLKNTEKKLHFIERDNKIKAKINKLDIDEKIKNKLMALLED